MCEVFVFSGDSEIMTARSIQSIFFVIACHRAPDPITLAVISGLEATTEPCGCTSKPLGGLPRILGATDALKKQGKPFGVIFAGSTFFSDREDAAVTPQQTQARAQAIAEILSLMNPTAIVTSPADQLYPERLRIFARDFQLPIFARAQTQTTKWRADSTLRTIGSLKMGFVGISGNTNGEADAYTAGALMLRRQGADVVIAILPISGDVAKKLTSQMNAIDIVIAGGHEHPEEPLVLAETLYVETKNKGQELGLLRLYPKGDKKPWVYYPQGRAEKHELTARIKRLRQELTQDLPDAAKKARGEKIVALEQELHTVTEETPNDSYVTWDKLNVDASLVMSEAVFAKAETRLVEYNRSLCAIQEALAETCTKPEYLRDQYVGSESCRICHTNAHSFYSQTAHSRAWQTLVKKGKECDPLCIGCHSVGYREPGGYCNFAESGPFQNVGCENCHGPGAGHAMDPKKPQMWAKSFSRKVAAEKCMKCHNKDHSDLFDYEQYLPKILGPGHGKAIL